MTKHLEHAGLGLSFELPDIRQRDMEALHEAERSIRRRREANRPEIIAETAEDVLAAIVSAQRGKFRPASPELAALVNLAAEGIVQRMSNTPLDDLTNQETCGVWARAAARLGWLGEIAEEDIGDMRLGAVLWIGLQLLELIKEAREIPNA